MIHLVVDQPADRIEVGSDEAPEVLRTLAGVLPQFEGANLESQLQTYDMFLGMLAPSIRPRIADLLREAASRTKQGPARERILNAAESVARGGAAAEPYNHAKAMEEYQQSFRQSFPNAPEPAAPADPRGETDPRPETPPGGKRSHPEILTQIDLIEAEMKRIGYWSANPPDLLAAAERGELKSYLDAPTFELWLQALFIPRARKAAQEDMLPSNSMVREMARRQYDYMSVDYNAENLLKLLQRFDEMVIQAAA